MMAAQNMSMRAVKCFLECELYCQRTRYAIEPRLYEKIVDINSVFKILFKVVMNTKTQYTDKHTHTPAYIHTLFYNRPSSLVQIRRSKRSEVVLFRFSLDYDSDFAVKFRTVGPDREARTGWDRNRVARLARSPRVCG